MYLKNTSTKTSVVINTARGKVGIRPGEVVDIRYKVLPPISTALKQVEKEEFLNFIEEKEGIAASIIKEQSGQITPPQDEESIETMERINDTPPEDEIDIKDEGIMGFVNSLLEKKENTALVVTETDSTDETNQLEQQISDLQASWAETRNPRKKEKIAKEIKELQKQLKKIGK